MLLVLLLALGLGHPPQVAGQGLGGGADRSRRLVQLTCASDVARRDITLFANGTVRLREWQSPSAEIDASDLDLAGARSSRNEPRLALGELSQEDLAEVLDRLGAEDLSESEERDSGDLRGEWVEICQLALRLDGVPPRDLSFNRYATLSLATSRVLEIVLELAEGAQEELASERSFPKDYHPRHGDVVERFDGRRFEVLRFTDDGAGVELRGVTEPLTLYVARTDIRTEFRRLVSRR